MQRALAAQEKQAMRLRTRHEATASAPRDDADIEWEALLAAYRARNGCGGGQGQVQRVGGLYGRVEAAWRAS